jgi:hypothetical protein
MRVSKKVKNTFFKVDIVSQLGKHFSTITILVIVLGCINLSSYYSFFQIPAVVRVAWLLCASDPPTTVVMGNADFYIHKLGTLLFQRLHYLTLQVVSCKQRLKTFYRQLLMHQWCISEILRPLVTTAAAADPTTQSHLMLPVRPGIVIQNAAVVGDQRSNPRTTRNNARVCAFKMISVKYMSNTNDGGSPLNYWIPFFHLLWFGIKTLTLLILWCWLGKRASLQL